MSETKPRTKRATSPRKRTQRVHAHVVNPRSALEAVRQRLSGMHPLVVVGVGIAAGAVAARLLPLGAVSRWARLLPGVIAATFPVWIEAAGEHVGSLKRAAQRVLP